MSSCTPRAYPTPPTSSAALLIGRLDSHLLKQFSEEPPASLCLLRAHATQTPLSITREPSAVIAAAATKYHAGVSRAPRVRRGAAAAAGMLYHRQGMEGDEERRHGAFAAPGELPESAASTRRGDGGAQRQRCG